MLLFFARGVPGCAVCQGGVLPPHSKGDSATIQIYPPKGVIKPTGHVFMATRFTGLHKCLISQRGCGSSVIAVSV